MLEELEEGERLHLDYRKLAAVATTGAEVVPVVVQNADNGQVIVLAYANAEAVQTALRMRCAVFWSTSRNELWIKGATSGDVLDLVEIRVNCEQNSLLYLVRPRGGGCHTHDAAGVARPSCYYRRLEGDRLTAAGAPPKW